MTTQPLKRRNFLRGMAFGVPVAIGLPILEGALNSSGTAFADGTDLPRRFGIFFWGNGRGTEPARWNPAQAGTDWQPSPQLAPLAAYKSHLNVVTGMRVELSNSPQGHHKGTVGILSGRDFVQQPASNAPFRSTFAGPSIDQMIAQEIGATTAFRSLELGVFDRVIRGEGTTLQFLSHNGPDNANPPEYEPGRLFDRLFAHIPTGTDPGLVQRANEMQQSVLDSIVKDLDSLKTRVGSRDRIRVEQHLDNIRAIEQRLGSSGPQTEACRQPLSPAQNIALMSERMQAMSDLTALALACDLTRVFSIMFSGSAAGPVFSEIGQTRGHHQLSHEETAQPEIDAATIFTMEQFGKLLGALDSIAEGDTTLLGQSAILATSDTSDGYLHSVNDYPIVVAGGAGGFFRSPGVHFASARENTSKVLLSLVRSMGIQASEFGADAGRVTESCTAIEA